MIVALTVSDILAMGWDSSNASPAKVFPENDIQPVVRTY